MSRTLVLAAALSAILLASAEANGAAPEGADPAVVDRVAVRLVAAETGGPPHPRYLMEREVAFFARVEALAEQAETDDVRYPDRYVRTAIDRLVAREMLAALLVQRGSEPPDLQRLTSEARTDLEARVGGAATLTRLLEEEGLSDEELRVFLRDQVRATYYVDRGLAPILDVSEDQLREAHRGAAHPFRGLKLEEARTRLRRWIVVERLRASELEFLQSARTRIQIVVVTTPARPGGAS